MVLSALLALPLIHDDFIPLFKARYTMPLVPLVYVAVAVLLARMGTLPAPGPRIVAVSAALLMMGGMLSSLRHFQSEMIANDCTNRPQRTFVADWSDTSSQVNGSCSTKGCFRPLSGSVSHPPGAVKQARWRNEPRTPGRVG